MIKVSAKAFAQFLLGSSIQHAATVRNVLRPKEPEAIIPSSYYKRAISIIRTYHEAGNKKAAIQDGIASLDKLLESASSIQARTQLRKNMEAVHSYMNVFSDRTWQVVSCPRFRYVFGSVSISGRPDFAVSHGDKLLLIKLGVRRKKESTDLTRVMLRVIYQAATQKLSISPADIIYLDLATGAVVPGSPSDKKLAGVIDEGCSLLEKLVKSAGG